MPFNIDGFLSSDLKGWIDSVRSDHKVWFDLAEELNKACMEAMYSIQPLPSSNKQMVASLIFGRALESFQGVILLAERGMMADARTLVRSCTESAIAIGCASVDDDFLDDLIAGNVKHHTTFANKILSSSDILSHMELEQTDKLKQLLDNLKNERSDSIRWEQAAQKAGLSVLYNTVYRGTSGDAAHVTIDSLNRHIQKALDQKITGLNFQPEADDIDDTLSGAISALLSSLFALAKTFERADNFQVVLNYTKKRKELVLANGIK